MSQGKSTLKGLDLLNNIDNKALIEFVCMCSRFEYALKQVPGYREAQGRYRKKKPLPAPWNIGVCWRVYAGKFDSDIRASPELIDAIRKYDEKIIQKQVISKEDKLIWVDDQSEEILNKVYRVRNNLFHGGKESNRNTSRNSELLKAGSQILDVAWTLDPEVKLAYRMI